MSARNYIGEITLHDVGRAYFYQWLARPEQVDTATRHQLRLAICWNDRNACANWDNEWSEIDTDDAREAMRIMLRDARE